MDGKPMTGGLQNFALRAMQMVKTAIVNDYPLEVGDILVIIHSETTIIISIRVNQITQKYP